MKNISFRKEFENLVSFYYDSLRFRLQQQLIIIGPKGSGKTLASRFYGKKAKEFAEEKSIDFKLIYINLKGISSESLFWQRLLQNLGLPVPACALPHADRPRQTGFDKKRFVKISISRQFTEIFDALREVRIIPGDTLIWKNSIHRNTKYYACNAP